MTLLGEIDFAVLFAGGALFSQAPLVLILVRYVCLQEPKVLPQITLSAMSLRLGSYGSHLGFARRPSGRRRTALSGTPERREDEPLEGAHGPKGPARGGGPSNGGLPLAGASHAPISPQRRPRPRRDAQGSSRGLSTLSALKVQNLEEKLSGPGVMACLDLEMPSETSKPESLGPRFWLKCRKVAAHPFRITGIR